MSEQILIVDDDKIFRNNLARYLAYQDYRVVDVASGEEALEASCANEFAVVLTNIELPDMSGLELIDGLTKQHPQVAAILITAEANVDAAIDGARSGAFDYVLKPVVFEDIMRKVENVLSHKQLRSQVARLRRELEKQRGFEELVGQSEQIQQIVERIDRVSELPATVLITGERGTGKELVARTLHDRSNQGADEFVAVNIPSVPDERLESLFFGSVDDENPAAEFPPEGIFRWIDGGTIFLDEVGNLSMEMQTKLLEAIEQQRVVPVGATRAVDANFHLMAAMSRPLEKMVDKGTFRRDLFHRLNVFRIELPPLREHREDIPILAHHFADLHTRGMGRAPASFSEEVMKLFVDYNWPGNVRELSNMIERALIVTEGEIVTADVLPQAFTATATQRPLSLKHAVEHYERQHIRDVLRIADGNREQTAKLLEIDPATLYRRLSKYDIH